jgi:hypothetical protein
MAIVMTNTVQFLIGLSVTLLGGLIAVVWHTGRLSARLEAAIAELRSSLDKLSDGLKQIQRIPVLEKQVGVLERRCESCAARFDQIWDTIYTMKTRVAILDEARRPGSSSDLTREANEASDDVDAHKEE